MDGARTLLSALVKKLRRSRDKISLGAGLEWRAVSPASHVADRSVRAPGVGLASALGCAMLLACENEGMTTVRQDSGDSKAGWPKWRNRAGLEENRAELFSSFCPKPCFRAVGAIRLPNFHKQRVDNGGGSMAHRLWQSGIGGQGSAAIRGFRRRDGSAPRLDCVVTRLS